MLVHTSCWSVAQHDKCFSEIKIGVSDSMRPRLAHRVPSTWLYFRDKRAMLFARPWGIRRVERSIISRLLGIGNKASELQVMV